MKRLGSISAKRSRYPLLATAFRVCARGSVAVELALLAPVLAGVLIGIVDIGTYINQKMQLQSAARAGAQYAIQSDGNAEDTAGIFDVVAAASNMDAGFTVTSVAFCGCADGTETTVSTTGCGGTCAGGDSPALSVRVTVSNTFTPIFPYPGLPDSVDLQGQTSLRVP